MKEVSLVLEVYWGFGEKVNFMKYSGFFGLRVEKSLKYAFN